MKFSILGPLEVISGSARIELAGTRQQIVIATLLLSANRVVSTDRLLQAIYDGNLPPTSRAQAQISISSLRRLFASYVDDKIISTREHGYVIRVADGELDSEQFRQLVMAARAAGDAKRYEQALAGYRDALRLWRGPALDGIDSELVRAAASRLDELRIATNEDRIKLELDLGRHRELVGELTELVHEFPLREQLRGLLMLALYRSDRAAEALEIYRQARQTMVDELGIEPGERLQRLEHAILLSDPSLMLPAEPARIPQVFMRQVPNLLPTDIADFTGRADQLSQIRGRLLGEAARSARRPVPVVVITGQGGIGKTSLATHAAHSVAGHFPDGLLFADLHGGTSNLVRPTAVLERFLRALGVPTTQIPEGLDERAEVYRSLVADRKILVVLDDAASENQVWPLLPGGGGAGVIITTRRRLTGLAGACHVEMDVLDTDVSLELLARIAGKARVQAEHEAAVAVVSHCGRLPLALRIAGARLSARPHWSIQDLGDRLADETRRLDELRHGDMGIRPSIVLTYENITEQARQLFRRLALLDVPGFSGWLSAALLDQPLDAAEDVLDDLISAQLIESAGDGSSVHGQYRFHDLIRVFARERLVEEPAAERKAALERALGALFYVAEAAQRRYFGGDYTRIRCDAPRWPPPARLVERLVSDPLSWYDRERVTLVAGVRQAAQAGLAGLSWGLASRAVPLFESRIYLDDWQETHEIALAAARKARDVRGQAAMLNSIGSFHLTQQRIEPARTELTEAGRLFQEVGDERGVALVARDLAYLDRLNGRLDDATRRYKDALTVFRKFGDRITTASALHGLAQVSLELNQVDDAKELLAEALLLCRAAQCGRVEAQVLHRLGEAHLLAGELTDAVTAFELSLTISSEIGDLVGQSYALQGTGVARVRQSEFAKARNALQNAKDLAVTARERLVEARALFGLGELALASGDPGQAIVFGKDASDVFHEIGAVLYGARAYTLLSDAHAALGDGAAAAIASTEAVALRAKQRHGGLSLEPSSPSGIAIARGSTLPTV